jgi:hypothetical protein
MADRTPAPLPLSTDTAAPKATAPATITTNLIMLGLLIV